MCGVRVSNYGIITDNAVIVLFLGDQVIGRLSKDFHVLKTQQGGGFVKQVIYSGDKLSCSVLNGMAELSCLLCALCVKDALAPFFVAYSMGTWWLN